MADRYSNRSSGATLRCSAIVLALICSMALRAQVATNYVFTQASGTYSAIGAGSTLLWNGSFDDNISVAQTIPAFTFNGTVYNQMYVSANGFITFGSAPAGDNYTPLSSAAGYAGAISAFGTDMNSAPSSVGTRDVRWQTVGNEVVVQWQNVRRYNMAGFLGSNPENFDFQIRLNTSTGVIRIVYGSLSNHNSSTDYQPEVGLRGPSNLFATNVNNRRVTNGSDNWPTSLSGTANDSKCRFKSGTGAKAFTSGLTYTWTPAGCNSLPTPGNTNGPASTCSGVSLDLTVQNSSIGTSYQWEYSTVSNSGPWTTFGSNSGTQSATQSVATWYRAAVTCPGHGTAYSAPILVSMTNFMNCYCTAGATNSGFERITRVTVANIDHPSTANVGYEDHTAVVGNMLLGSTYDLTVQYGWNTAPNGYAVDQVLVWIDFNQNGSFADPGETVFTSAPGLSPRTGNIIIPGTALPGNTRMRVRLHDTTVNGYPNTPNATPCSTSTYGQVEDYTINILPAILYSTASGNMNSNIWSYTPAGGPSGASVNGDVKVVIQNGHNVAVTGLINVGDLDLQAGATLSIGSEQRLVVEGDEVLLNGAVSGTGELSLESAAATTVTASGTITLGDLIVNSPSGTTIQGNFDLSNSLRLDGGVLNASAANVKLLSTATGTARLGTVAPGADYIGELTMQRHIPGGVTNWRLLGSSVENRTVADWNDDFFTAGFPGSNYPPFYVNGVLWPSIRFYDETVGGSNMNDGLVGVPGTSHQLQHGRGYAVWSGDALGGTQAFNVDVKGEPIIAQSPLSLPMTFTNTGNASIDGWNLVANPLPSPIAFNLIDRGADVENSYWIYNPTNGNNASWNGVVGTNGANGIIQSSQGFWLKANGPAVATTVNEDDKVAGNAGGLFGGLALETELPLVRLKISSGMNTFSDEAVIVFTEGSPEQGGNDVAYFAWSHPSAPRISSRSSDGADLSINMYGEFTEEISIPINVGAPVNGTYTIKATELAGVDQYSCLMIEDLLTGTITPLTSDVGYSFNLLSTADPMVPRFMLHATTPVQHTLNNVACNGGSTGIATVILPSASATDVIWMNAAGVAFAEQGSMVGSASMDGLAAGDYMVSVSSDAGCGSLISNFTIAEPFALESEITINDATCPNIEDGSISLALLGGVEPYAYTWSNGSNDASITAIAGMYSVTVSDANGCMITNTDLEIGSGVGPDAGFETTTTVVGLNEPIEFNNTSSGAEQYFWNFGDGTTSTDASPVHVFTLPGEYTVSLTTTGGNCTDTHSAVITVEFTTAIEGNNNSTMNVWTSNEHFVIDGIGNNGAIGISAIDAAGKIHIDRKLQANGGRIEIPTAGLASGIWMIQVDQDGERSTYKVPLMR